MRPINQQTKPLSRDQYVETYSKSLAGDYSRRLQQSAQKQATRDSHTGLDYNLLLAAEVGEKLLSSLDDVLVALRKVIRATDIHSKHLAKTTGLTAPQILLLQTIRENGQMTIGELAGEMSLSQATVTTILDRLEKRELVFRERSNKDKRKVHAHLTEQALETLKEAPTPLQEQFAKRFARLDEWEQSMIISSLQRVARMMDADGIDASPVLDLGILDRQDNGTDRNSEQAGN